MGLSWLVSLKYVTSYDSCPQTNEVFSVLLSKVHAAVNVDRSLGAVEFHQRLTQHHPRGNHLANKKTLTVTAEYCGYDGFSLDCRVHSADES